MRNNNNYNKLTDPMSQPPAPFGSAVVHQGATSSRLARTTITEQDNFMVSHYK